MAKDQKKPKAERHVAKGTVHLSQQIAPELFEWLRAEKEASGRTIRAILEAAIRGERARVEADRDTLKKRDA